jgi:hypothetical protein
MPRRLRRREQVRVLLPHQPSLTLAILRVSFGSASQAKAVAP